MSLHVDRKYAPYNGALMGVVSTLENSPVEVYEVGNERPVKFFGLQYVTKAQELKASIIGHFDNSGKMSSKLQAGETTENKKIRTHRYQICRGSQP